MKVKSESDVAQSCPTLSDPMGCSLPGFSIHGIFQARVLEWVAICLLRDMPVRRRLRLNEVLSLGSNPVVSVVLYKEERKKGICLSRSTHWRQAMWTPCEKAVICKPERGLSLNLSILASWERRSSLQNSQKNESVISATLLSLWYLLWQPKQTHKEEIKKTEINVHNSTQLEIKNLLW